jgi:hypothetical protein
MGDYSGERYDPDFGHCANLRLFFDGSYLRLSGGATFYSFQAVSGRPLPSGGFDYSTDRQKLSGTGPIPEGIYWIRPDEIDDNWLNCALSSKFCDSWGRYRITIHPFTTTVTHGRGGFFIHGGAVAGSAGCIDLTSRIDTFVYALFSELRGFPKCQIHLEVRYPKLGDYPLPQGGTAVT